MEIQVVEIRLLPGDKPTRAFADLEINNIKVRDFRIIRSNGKPYVRNPFTAYKNEEGNLLFREIITLLPDAKAEVDALILGAYFRKLKEKESGISQPR